MNRGVLYRRDHPQPLLADVILATRLTDRMRGLLFRPPLHNGQAMLILPCSSVHTFGMRYAIDLIFLNKNWRIRKLVHMLKPCRIAWAPGAHMVVEMAAGTLAGFNLTLDTKLYWEDKTCA